MSKEKLLPESWLYEIADNIRDLKKCEYQETRNECIDEIVTKIARKFQDLGVSIYLDEEWSV